MLNTDLFGSEENIQKLLTLFHNSSFNDGVTSIGESDKFTPEQAKAFLAEMVDKTAKYSPTASIAESIKFILVNNFDGQRAIALVFGNGDKGIINMQVTALAMNVMYYLLTDNELHKQEIQRFLTELPLPLRYSDLQKYLDIVNRGSINEQL